MLVYAVAVFVSFLAGLLAMARFSRRQRQVAAVRDEPARGAVVVAFTLVVNLARGYPLIAIVGTVLIAAFSGTGGCAPADLAESRRWSGRPKATTDGPNYRPRGDERRTSQLPVSPEDGGGDQRSSLWIHTDDLDLRRSDDAFRGIPTAWEALLFLAGAVLGFGVTAALAYGRPSEILASREHGTVRLWGGFHLVSVGLAIGGAALVTATVKDPVAWMIVGFVATFVYLVVIAGQFALADSHGG